MTEVARLLLDGINEDAVDFRRTTTASREEPWCCRRRSQPAGERRAGHRGRHGDLDPPHNVAELCDAALHLIDNPNATLARRC
jgi:topoisomerase-4 subunit A